jgi:hypothetical protein
LAQHHGEPLRTRVIQGIGLAVAITAVNTVLQPHGMTGLSAKQVTILLVAVALAGGVAGAGYYATDALRAHSGWRRTGANVLTLLVFCALAFFLVMVLY